jgi:F0F1-type ATP synthase assembly protein I
MQKDSWNIAFRIMGTVSGWIAFPIIIGLFVGTWLDEKFGTAPWLFIATISFAFVVSMYGLISNSLREFKILEREARENKASEAAVVIETQPHKQGIQK